MEQQSQWKGFMDVLFLGAVGIDNKTASGAYNGQGPAGLSYLVPANQELNPNQFIWKSETARPILAA